MFHLEINANKNTYHLQQIKLGEREKQTSEALVQGLH